MKGHRAIPIVLATMAVAMSTGVQCARSQNAGDESSVEQKLKLTPAQRSSIYAAASQDKSKTAPQRFPAVVGAEVPPMISLYVLPDDVVADNPAAKLYEYTMVQDQVVLVDPTKMRVIDIIGPPAR